MKTTYDVNDAVGRIDTSTEKLSALDMAVQYNEAIWSPVHAEHMIYMSTLASIGDFSALRRSEVSNLVNADYLN